LDITHQQAETVCYRVDSSAAGAQVDFVDQTTGLNPPGLVKLPGQELGLNAFAVAVVSLPK
jgi:hypothetical protein